MWAIIIFSVLTIAGLVYLSTGGQDRNTLSASKHLAGAAIKGIQKELSIIALEYSYWDQAVENLVTDLNPRWADTNIGKELNRVHGVSSSYVIAPGQKVLYSSIGEERRADDPFARFSGGVARLVADSLVGEQTAEPKPVIGLIQAGDVPYLAAASVLTDYFDVNGEEVKQRTDTVLFLTQELGEEPLAGLAEKYLLHGLRFVNQLGPDNSGEASLPLIAANGETIGFLVWNPNLPGRAIFAELLVGVLIVFAFLAWMMVTFFSSARRVSTELEQKSELLKTTMDSIDQGVASWDENNRLLIWNAKCKDFWYYPGNLSVGLPKEQVLAHIETTDGPRVGEAEEQAQEPHRDGARDGKNSFQEIELRDGRHFLLSTYPMPSGGHTTVYTDITQRKMAELLLVQQATIDPVTQLPNRALLYDRINQALASARRHDRNLALLFCDLDRFKQINDTYGHEAGDKLLRTFGRKLQSLVRKEDTVARLGGDEFVIVLPNIEIPEGPETVANTIIAAFAQPLIIDGESIAISSSIGAAFFPWHGEDAEALLKCADKAMYRAKRLGRCTFYVFDRSSVQEGLDPVVNEAM
ncbi:MAG: diguanylate cyclase domain-containing protein [Magnetovibrionaceae bacterium]